MSKATDAGSFSVVPMLPLRDVVVFPHMVIPLFVGRDRSVKALETAMDDDKRILLVTQKDAAVDDPEPHDLYSVGTVATILQLLRLPDGTVKVLVEGVQRAQIQDIRLHEFFEADVSLFHETEMSDREAAIQHETLLAEFEKYSKLSKKVPQEVIGSLDGIKDIHRLVDTMVAHLDLKIQEKQDLLELHSIRERVDELLSRLDHEIDLIEVERRIRGRVKKQMEKSQREYYLNEQMKAIQKEMGSLNETGNEFDDIEKRIKSSGMSPEARKKAEQELGKLKLMSPMSAEATVVRSYIDWLLSVPWKQKSKIRNDIAKAREILEEDHYGLDEVKERILEYLAVQGRVKKLKGPVLCLVGPPGVGKTSLGQSIARATNRQFTRMALGGVRDEAEIRGHRRTYIGSLPGKLVQKLAKVGVRNPLFLLDEIDKMGMDHRGDPASALLEVLDPEQNHTFSDHYLEVDYDLSDVMFVCTSNSMNIPPALLDRMEIIRIPGYTEDEKVNIAQRYLIAKQVKMNGIKEGEVEIQEDAIRAIIRYYTREAGVRGLEREIAKVCRKVVMAQTKEKQQLTVNAESLGEWLGVRKYTYGIAEKEDQIGQVTGLAWTQVGGELLTIECAVTPGKGQIVKTGSLGDVMQESIQAALTVVKSRARVLGLTTDFYQKIDVHVHVPEGATPKDGPSAGIGMCTALVSALTGVSVCHDVAMTGEITLRGRVLQIGGLKEKLLAAHRGGVKRVLIPEDNVRDLKEIPENIKSAIEIIPVRTIDDVLKVALVRLPVPLPDQDDSVSVGKAVTDDDAEKIDRPNTH